MTKIQIEKLRDCESKIADCYRALCIVDNPKGLVIQNGSSFGNVNNHLTIPESLNEQIRVTLHEYYLNEIKLTQKTIDSI